ncbi:LPXTG cell wall anchor domain-containing protein [Streptomyces sp. NPDC052496]|uniref:LPXTG cell wall anchor domain-containing protein n=1 Tax=Streptomyces sp. NPDC052496 TaxID=3154951 RepID=UPI003428F1A5
MYTTRQGKRASVVAAAAATLALAAGPAALAADPVPGSSAGGKAGPSAPAGYRVTTELPERISVKTATGATTLTAKVTNKGSADTGAIRLTVAGFQGLTVKNVAGCTKVPEARLPEGANSAYSCAIGSLASGMSRTYQVTAQFDLKKQGQICLPVTLRNTDTLLWQQGPVDFGTRSPVSDAPDTPLMLNTVNVPAGSATTSPAPSEAGSTAPAQRLPQTGAPSVLPLAGAAAALLLLGGAGVWVTTRRSAHR